MGRKRAIILAPLFFLALVIPVAIAQGGYEVAPNTTDPSGEYYVGDDSAVSSPT
jgi:hypothetical protein